MVNEVVLVGLVKGIEECNQHQKYLYVEIEKQFKDGYERKFDSIKCKYWKSIFERDIRNFKTGDTIAIRGRIEEEDKVLVVAIEKVVLLNKTKHNVLKSI